MRATLRIDRHLQAGDLTRGLRRDALLGLTSAPKEMPPKWFYDERGSVLFEEITRLPEYYLTRTEREILESRAASIAECAGADTLVELGSGTSEKTRLLLDAFSRSGDLRRFVPFDVCEEILKASAEAVASEYPGVEVNGLVGDFERHLPMLPEGDRRLVIFLGSTIGNLDPVKRAGFLGQLSNVLSPGEGLLLGVDLVKDVDRLEAAYNDRAGVTAEFNRNVLAVLNAQLGANFAPEHFEHVALFDHENEWIEMRLCSTRTQSVTLATLGLTVRFGEGEQMRTEISAKFRRPGVVGELAAAGFELERWWTDTRADFALALARRRSGV